MVSARLMYPSANLFQGHGDVLKQLVITAVTHLPRGLRKDCVLTLPDQESSTKSLAPVIDGSNGLNQMLPKV